MAATSAPYDVPPSIADVAPEGRPSRRIRTREDVGSPTDLSPFLPSVLPATGIGGGCGSSVAEHSNGVSLSLDVVCIGQPPPRLGT